MLNRILHKMKTPNLGMIYSIICFLVFEMTLVPHLSAQVKWKNVSTEFGKIPPSINVLSSSDLLDGAPSIMFVAEIKSKDKKIDFYVDTTSRRRLTPQQYFSRSNNPYVVVNCSFFEFVQNRNVNIIVQDSKIVGFDTPAVSRKGKDTLTCMHTLGSAFGIYKNRKMDIAFNYNDSSLVVPYVMQSPYKPTIDSSRKLNLNHPSLAGLKKWKVSQAFGGGPVLVQEGQIRISNNEERKFAGKAISDKHPRTAIGYKKDGTMVILAVQGRMKGLAEGATLPQMAKILVDLGCIEAMNLDGGGSSCMLINGKETIKPSDPTGQRPVPAVFVVKAN
jgi:exopolysaccharide biosynthesis protein